MKTKTIKLLLLLTIILGGINLKAQTPTCSELYSYVKQKGGYPTTQYCYGSSFIVKAERYTVDGTGVAVIWMKNNDYDITGTPYIYCGISIMTWSNFTSAGVSGSWGKAFHQYIKGRNCDCN